MNDACYWEDICRNRNVNWRGIFHLFLMAWLTFSPTVAVCHPIYDLHLKDSVGLEVHMCEECHVCVCVSAHMRKNGCDYRAGWSAAG